MFVHFVAVVCMCVWACVRVPQRFTNDITIITRSITSGNRGICLLFLAHTIVAAVVVYVVVRQLCY